MIIIIIKIIISVILFRSVIGAEKHIYLVFFVYLFFIVLMNAGIEGLYVKNVATQDNNEINH